MFIILNLFKKRLKHIILTIVYVILHIGGYVILHIGGYVILHIGGMSEWLRRQT